MHNSEAEANTAQLDCAFVHGEATNGEHDRSAGVTARQTRPLENSVLNEDPVSHYQH